MKTPSLHLSLYLIVLIALSTGCASIMSGPNQVVSVKSKPEGAKATFYNDKGIAVASGNTPMMVTLKRRDDYILKVEKDQYEAFQTPVSGGLNGWYLGNVIFGGLIGFIIVDPATGAMWSLSPDDVTVEMAAASSGGTSKLLTDQNLPSVAAKRRGAVTGPEHREIQNNYSNFERRR